MTFTAVDYRIANRVAKLTLNRPERMNAINATMYDELCRALAQASEDDQVRVLLVTGAGDRAFCAGLDLDALGRGGPMDAERVRERTVHPERSLNGALLGFEKPFIAAVNGVATGGGLGIALAADIVIAADSARFGTAHVKLALPLLDMLGFLLPRRVGPGVAADLAFTGRLVEASEAQRIGLADRTVAASELARHAEQLAEEIAAKAPLALHFSKQAIRRADSEIYQEYMRYERYIFGVCFNSDDAREAVRARRQKRPAAYTGR